MAIRIILNWIIIATAPFLLGNSPELKFSGNFKTQDIRELWQMCSVAHQQAKVAPTIYFPHCDCAVDTMRRNFDNASVFRYMKKPNSEKLAVLVRLSCNEYRTNGAGKYSQ